WRAGLRALRCPRAPRRSGCVRARLSFAATTRCGARRASVASLLAFSRGRVVAHALVGVRMRPRALAVIVLMLGACRAEAPFSRPLKLSDRTVPADVLNRGFQAYRASCRPCHGDEGDGHGVSAYGLRPPPRDFTQGLFKFGHVVAPSLPPD